MISDLMTGDTNIAILRSEPGLMGATRAQAIRIIDDADEPSARRQAAARFLWQTTTLPHRWAETLRAAQDPTLPRKDRLDALEWCARRACCELHDRALWAAKQRLEAADNAMEGA